MRVTTRPSCESCSSHPAPGCKAQSSHVASAGLGHWSSAASLFISQLKALSCWPWYFHREVAWTAVLAAHSQPPLGCPAHSKDSLWGTRGAVRRVTVQGRDCQEGFGSGDRLIAMLGPEGCHVSWLHKEQEQGLLRFMQKSKK